MRHFLAALIAAFQIFSFSGNHVVARAQMSVVRLTTEDGGVCSGEVVTVDQVLTAYHCLQHGLVRVDGVLAKVMVAGDQFYDLGLLQIQTNRPLLPMRDEPVLAGESLTALGYGFGMNAMLTFPVRVILPNANPFTSQEDPAAPGILVQPEYIGGMSGGPVIDGAGQMVGIIQRKGEGVGYGVGMVMIRAFLAAANAVRYQ